MSRHVVNGGNFTAVTAAFGMNATAETRRHAVLLEATRRDPDGVFLRAEVVDVESSLLMTDTVPSLHDASLKNAVGAFTLGGVRDLLSPNRFQAGVGAGVTVDAVPSVFHETHEAWPVSFQVFFRLRPPAGAMGRMWNMRMAQPMKSMAAPVDHHMHMH
jgi:hypothetical protein